MLNLKTNYKLNDSKSILPLNLNNLHLNNITNTINQELDQIQNCILNNNNINNIIGDNKINIPEQNKINLIYYTNYKGFFEIFGKKFVQNNRENIELNINDKQNPVVEKYELKEGKNKITLVIKNHLTNLSNMFYLPNI